MVRLLLILVAALSWVPAHAQQSELVGEWMLNSFVVESRREIQSDRRFVAPAHGQRLRQEHVSGRKICDEGKN